MKVGYLERAHRVACEMGNAFNLGTLNRELMTEIAGDIEAFVKTVRERDTLNRMHAVRHINLPETEGKE